MTPTYYRYKRLRDIGMTHQEVADACGVKLGTVASTISRFSTTERYEHFKDKQRKLADSKSRAMGRRRRSDTRTTDAWARQAADMRKSGLSSSEIGRVLGVSRNAVVGALWRRGL